MLKVAVVCESWQVAQLVQHGPRLQKKEKICIDKLRFLECKDRENQFSHRYVFIIGATQNASKSQSIHTEYTHTVSTTPQPEGYKSTRSEAAPLFNKEADLPLLCPYQPHDVIGPPPIGQCAAAAGNTANWAAAANAPCSCFTSCCPSTISSGDSSCVPLVPPVNTGLAGPGAS
jgi:hypothetical protein